MRPRARDYRQAADEVERFYRRQAVIDALKAEVGARDRPTAIVVRDAAPRVWLAAAWALVAMILLVALLVELTHL